MSDSRPNKPSRGSVRLKRHLAERNATKTLAAEMKVGTDLVSRWAAGGRKPLTADRVSLQLKFSIPLLDWDIELSERQVAAFARDLEREASAEPVPAFPAGDEPANGGAGHAA